MSRQAAPRADGPESVSRARRRGGALLRGVLRGYAISLSTWLLVLAATALTTGEQLVERIVRGGGSARGDLARLLGRSTLLWLLLAAAVVLIARTASRAGDAPRGVDLVDGESRK
jgi:hypothetical protein